MKANTKKQNNTTHTQKKKTPTFSFLSFLVLSVMTLFMGSRTLGGCGAGGGGWGGRAGIGGTMLSVGRGGATVAVIPQ